MHTKAKALTVSISTCPNHTISLWKNWQRSTTTSSLSPPVAHLSRCQSGWTRQRQSSTSILAVKPVAKQPTTLCTAWSTPVVNLLKHSPTATTTTSCQDTSLWDLAQWNIVKASTLATAISTQPTSKCNSPSVTVFHTPLLNTATSLFQVMQSVKTTA